MAFDLRGSRPEHALTVCCARAQLDEVTVQRIRDLLKEPIDWNYLYNFARRHSVLQLLYPHLNAAAPDRVPPRESSRLKDYYQKNLGRNQYLTGELGRLLDTFAAEGIEAIPYKGPALAISAYGTLESRRFVDLDIMVRKADVLRAVKLLEGRGYRSETDWTEAQQALLMRTQHNIAMRKEEGRLIVELHWEVAPDLFAPSLQAELLWERLEPMSLNDLVVKTLSAEDLVLASCIHGSKHFWERLAWISDIAALLRRRKDLDWVALRRRARDASSDRMILLGLYLAHTLLDAPLPDDLKPELVADKAVGSLSRRVISGLFSGAEPVLPNLRESFSFNLRLRPSWRSRFRYCLMILRPTDKDLGAVSFPSSFSFAYYLLRPLRLLRGQRKRRLVANQNVAEKSN